MKRFSLIFTGVRLPLDYLTLFLAGLSAYALRFLEIFTTVRPVTFDLSLPEYISILLPLLFIVIPIFALSGLYTSRRIPLLAELTRITLAVSTAVAVVLAIAFFSRELFDSRFIFVSAWALAIIFVSAERCLLRFIERLLLAHNIGGQSIVIIGKTPSSEELKRFFQKYPRYGWRIVANYRAFNKETKKRLLELKERGQLTSLLIVDDSFHRRDIEEMKAFSDIEHLQFLYAAELVPGAVTQPIIHMFSGIPIVEVPKTPLDGWGAIYKRLFDIFVSSILIALSFPIQFITAIALLSEKQGGILFRQDRIGQYGKNFGYFKFRSMIKHAHNLRSDKAFLQAHPNTRHDSPMLKIKNDPRVTKVGKFIRAFSIDEIPEFYLVFLGKMSLVGPRPHLPEEVARYKPEQKRVLAIKPGITGLAQVSGRASLSFNEEVRLDIHYIENWSPWLDLVILLKTPFIVLFADGDGNSRLR